MGKLLGEAFWEQTKRHLSFRARVRELSTEQRNRVSTHWPQPPGSWKAGFLFLLRIEAGRGVGDDGVGDRGVHPRVLIYADCRSPDGAVNAPGNSGR